MNGLDKLIRHMTEETKAASEAILADAEKEAAEARSRIEKQADAQCKAIEVRARQTLENQTERGVAGAALKRRQAILAARQTLVEETVKAAKTRILELPDAEYFSYLLKLLERHVPGTDAVLLLNQRDRGRMPEDFVQAVERIAGEHDVQILISGQTAGISGGFVLEEGDVEENCSVEALIEADQDAIQDAVCRILFAQPQENGTKEA